MGFEFSWKYFGVILAANLLALIPFVNDAAGIWRLFLGNGVILALVIGIGLALSPWLGISLTLADTDSKPRVVFLRALLLGGMLAVFTLAARAMIAISFFEGLDLSGFLEFSRQSYPGFGGGVMISIADALLQETVGRLFVLPLIVALLVTLFPQLQLSPAAYWVGIGIAAIYNRGQDLVGTIFQPLGAGELLSLFSILVNIVPAIFFGWLVWKRGWLVGLACHWSMVATRMLVIFLF
ncbi:MAG: hypothetical protein FH749_01410 [Firmicutes bacterium]|nr:hypothetical protein [Bacillota bacterium]